MFFSEQFLFEHLSYYSKKIWYLVTLLIIIFIFFVWWKFFFVPMNKILKKHKENIVTLENQQNFEQDNRPDASTSFTLDESKILTPSQVTVLLLQKIRENHLDLKVKNSSPSIAKSFYKKSVFDFEISGTFEHVLDFLKDIRLANCLLKITKCEIKKNSENNVTCHLILHSLHTQKFATSDINSELSS